MAGTVTDIDAGRPHATTSIMCSACGHQWVAVYPVETMALECPGCHDAVNEYGTRVLLRHCKTCGRRFTVCPLPSPDRLDGWENCLDVGCASYDETRDADKLFDAGLVVRGHVRHDGDGGAP